MPTVKIGQNSFETCFIQKFSAPSSESWKNIVVHQGSSQSIL